MFILAFVVMFNTKKGSITVYRGGWHNMLLSQVLLLKGALSLTSLTSGVGSVTKATLYRFHFTIITSRTTSYLLFTFWVFFFFFGESLLLLTFNFTTPVDAINSFSFFNLKQHVVFMTSSLSASLLGSINFYIYFLTASAFLYLVNLNYTTSYTYYSGNTVTLVLMLFICILFF